MTIRAKLFAAIALTVIGPLVTIGVALQGQADLGDRFDDVQERARHEALARELKFGVTDVNGWQTAYGYDDGRSRPRFLNSVIAFREDLRTARAQQVTRRIFLGPELLRFEAMAKTAEQLARYERLQAAATEGAFDDARDDARKRLIAVGLGAGLVIVLLLVTAWDVARLALERDRR